MQKQEQRMRAPAVSYETNTLSVPRVFSVPMVAAVPVCAALSAADAPVPPEAM